MNNNTNRLRTTTEKSNTTKALAWKNRNRPEPTLEEMKNLVDRVTGR